MCGIKRPEDIGLVNELMPDYIGFVFAGFSSRYVSFETAKYLRSLLSPGIRAVGVFVNEDNDRIVNAVEDGIIDMVQLHGSESDLDIRYIKRKTGAEVIRAFKLSGHERYKRTQPVAMDVHKNDARLSDVIPHETGRNTAGTGRDGVYALTGQIMSCPADHVLIDSGMGSGRTFDWSLLDGIERDYFLAGGLTPENAAEAIGRLHPFALDVSSGIEKDGVKDKGLMEAFMKAVR